MDRFSSLPVLGVGVMYNPSLPEFLATDLDALDYLSITPDMFWTDRGAGRAPRFEELEAWVDVLDWAAGHRPIVAHNIGMSIGNAGGFDLEYVGHIARWQRRYHFPWHSDHLSFAEVTGPDGLRHNAGVALPVPNDFETLDLISTRVEQVREIVPVPFLLENSVAYVVFPDQDMSEPQFLNRLMARSGCGLLLDVHNVYVNARNHKFSAFDFVDELDLAGVVEMHIAGGTESAGMYTDSHAGPCPEEVWKLLEHVLDRAPHVRAITFEFHDSYYPLLGRRGIRAELARAREIFGKRSTTGVLPAGVLPAGVLPAGVPTAGAAL